jgi:Domain of unknown function (DUF4440)
MQAFVGNLIQRKPRRELSPEFKHALAREVLKTERLRIIALIITATVVAAALTTADVVAPAILDRIWRAHFRVLYLFAGYVGFVLFEASVLALVSRQLKRDRDVPRVRRYVGALVETSLPSLVLVLHMNNMGAVQALGFVGPLLYFVFIILSNLAPEFYCSNPDKSLVDRAAFLEQTAKPVEIKNLQAHDVKIRIMGHFAIIHAATSYTTPDGQQAHGRYTDCWAKQNGKWLAVSAHVTR